MSAPARPRWQSRLRKSAVPPVPAALHRRLAAVEVELGLTASKLFIQIEGQFPPGAVAEPDIQPGDTFIIVTALDTPYASARADAERTRLRAEREARARLATAGFRVSPADQIAQRDDPRPVRSEHELFSRAEHERYWQKDLELAWSDALGERDKRLIRQRVLYGEL